MRNSKIRPSPRIKGLVLAVHAALAGAAWALPQDATVVNGQVAISRAAPGALQITASNGAIINWKQFSIGASETTQFIQPNASSAVLNRVVGSTASQLLGQLKANGSVFLINPNGIVVGGGARIDTQSFIASTLDMTDSDFLAGKLRYFAGSAAGKIRNDGVITAGPGGRIALIAPDIENSGIIRAPDGNILLAAGRKLEIASLDLDGVTFEIQAPTDSVLNLGKLLADNGAVRAFAGSLRHSGEIQANRMVQQADGSIVLAGSNDITLTRDSTTKADGLAGGTIVVQSTSGTARVAGELTALGATGAGGDIRVLGQRVALESGAALDVSGSQAGGQILVGGDFQGRNPDVQNAQRVFVGTGATLRADATRQGDGGRVIVWADENTRYHGSLSAQGGPLGGDGGFAEVSGKGNLEFVGQAFLGAALGASGTLLLDPLDILVSLTSGILPVVVDEFTDFPSNIVTVSPSALAAVAGNVVLQAERDIYVRDAIALTTPGAGLTATAGGAMFDQGRIYNTAGISTTGGAVTLRAQGISGPGGVATNGGAVDLLTSSVLNYTGAISSGGGAVTLASQTSVVSSANVNAGAGTITVTGQTGVSGGSYTTLGTANLTATTGSVSSSDITAGIANLTATTGSVSSSDITAGVANLSALSNVNVTASVTDRVNASSTNSSVSITGDGAGPLRLGTVTSANSGIFLYGSNGFTQATGGLLTAPSLTFYNYNNAVGTGTGAAPITIAAPTSLVQPRVRVFDLGAPAHLAFSGSPTVGELSLSGTVAALAGSSVIGAANLSTLTLANASGVLSVSATSTGGFANGFSLEVNNGAINAANLTLPGAAVELTSTGAVTVGDMSGASLYITAQGPVTIGTATTTGNSGISVSTQSCYYYDYVACAAVSPITAGTLIAGGTGDINLYNGDNGAITVTTLTAGDDVSLDAGQNYPTSSGFPYTSQLTTNNIVLGTVTTAGRFSATNSGQGDVTITSLSAGDRVNIQAGNSFSPSYNVYQTSNNNISIGNVVAVGATGDYTVSNSGIGTINLTGTIDRTTSGDISVSTSNGSVTSTGNLLARDTISVTAGGTGALALAQLVSGSGSSNGNVTLSANGNLLFESVSATAVSTGSGNVSLTSSVGTVKASVDNTGLDITAAGNVTILAADTANGAIGDGSFANPLNIKAGAAKLVTLAAGGDIGASVKPITVDTSGSLIVSTTDGQFHVAATDGTTARSLSTIRLSASAAGIGAAADSTFTSADLSLTAASNGSTISIGDLVRSTGTLNEFSFSATGTSGLAVGNINLATIGYNQVNLAASGPITQLSGNISAGNVDLSAGASAVTVGNVTVAAGLQNRVHIAGGAITTGDLSAPAVDIAGANLDLGTVTSFGTSRGYANSFYTYVPRLDTYVYPLDELALSATGSISSGNIQSATSAFVSAGTGVTVGGSTGTINGGHFTNIYYSDTVNVGAGSGNLRAGNIAARNVTLTGATAASTALITGAVTADSHLSVGNASTRAVNTGALSGSSSLNLNAGSFATGNLSTNGSMSITANATGSGMYAPSGAIVLAGGVNGSVAITAPGGIDLVTGGTTLTAPTVALYSSNGNVRADLTNTSNLTVVTGTGFNVSSNTWLTNVDVTAKWDQATSMVSVGSEVRSTTGSGTQFFGYGFDGPLLLTASSTLAAGRSWNMTYHDLSSNLVMPGGSPSADDHVEAFLSHGGSGNLNLTFDSATVFKNTVATLPGGANVALASGGDIDLTNVATSVGSIDAYSYDGAVRLTSVSTGGGSLTARTTGDANQHIHVERVVTQGGDVYLDAANGNILRAGVEALQIDTRDTGLASGTVTLNAQNGRVGVVATPIMTSGAFALNVSALDDIAVVADFTPVTHLSIAAAASGTGAINVSNANYGGLSVTRDLAGTELVLAGLNPGSAGAFSLTATDGNLRVADNIGTVSDLTLRSYGGDVQISASGLSGARTIAATGLFTLYAGQDILVTAGSAASESVALSAGSLQWSAGRDIRVVAGGASATVTSNSSVFSQSINAGQDLVIAGGAGAGASALVAFNGASSYVDTTASRDLLVLGGSGLNASASLSVAGATSYMTVRANRDLTVAGGGGVDAFALVHNANTYQQSLDVSRDLTIHGGAGVGAYARVNQTYPSFGYQYASIDGNLSVLGGDASGGQGAGAYAELSGWYQSMPNIRGSILVAGGTAADNFAAITAGSSQILGTTASSGGLATDAVSVLGGAGDRAYARVSAVGSQDVYAAKDRTNPGATGDITVRGGAGADATAQIATASSQTLGGQSDYCYYYGCYDPTRNVLVQGGAGANAFASVDAVGFQEVYAGGTITILGSSGIGAYAQLLSSTSSQQIGSTSTSDTNATDAIRVQAGSGGTARILAQQGSQTIMTGTDLFVVGGTGAAMTASIEATLGSQTIGDTYRFSNDASGAITVQGGSGIGAAAWIKAASSQTIDAGGAIMIAGGAANASAEVITGNGFQRIGNLNSSSSYDQTDAITLTGGSAAGAYAGLLTSASQDVRASAAITLTGGVGDGSGARMQAVTGQSVTGRSVLAITGGSGTAAGGNESGIHNTTSGAQNLTITDSISVTGGGTGSDTGIFNAGTGLQSITSSSGSLLVQAPATSPNTDGVVGIESGTGGQVINATGGTITVNNAGALAAYIASDGTQTITTRSMAVGLSSPFSASIGPLAVVSAVGNQTITLNGDGVTPLTATLSVANLSSQTGSVAGVITDGNQVIQMDYDAAGLVKIGDATAKGMSVISAGGSLTMVAGQLLLQGGDGAGSNASLLSAQNDPLVGDMVISTLYGPVELKGGAVGGAFIDPPLLSITSNGSVLLAAGAGGPANVNINAGQFNLAATAGDLSLLNSTTSAATATITASTFNFSGPANVVLNGGTITALNSGVIDIVGECINCATNLIGPFSVRAYVPPPIPPTDVSALGIIDVITLAELALGPFDVTVDENGNVVSTRRRLSQCY